MNWRSTQRILGSRADAVNFRSNNAEQRGLGGGGGIKPNLSQYALQFDGTANSVCSVNSEDFNFSGDKPFSIASWVDVGNIANGASCPIFCRSNGTTIVYSLSVYKTAGGTTLELLMYSTTTANGIIIQIAASGAVGFNHYAMTYNGSNLASGVNLYVNGVNKTFTASKDNLIFLNTIQCANYIGRRVNTYGLGAIDDVLISNYKLSGTEIYELAKVSKSFKITELSFYDKILSYWGFDGNLKDKKNGYDLTSPTPIYLNSSNTAYLSETGNDSTAQLNNPSLRYKTIDAANAGLIAANTRYLKFEFKNGKYNSPTSTALTDNNLEFIGESMPELENLVSPTKLINGVIFNGILYITASTNITVKNIGIDVGLEWCNAYNSGVISEGFILTQSKNIRIDNVISLCKGPSEATAHANAFEYNDDMILNNVTGCFSAYSVVFKSKNVVATNLKGYGNRLNGLIIKKDTEHPVSNIRINGFYYRNMAGSICGSGQVYFMNMTATEPVNDVIVDNCDLDTTSTLVNCDANVSNVLVKGVNGATIFSK